MGLTGLPGMFPGAAGGIGGFPMMPNLGGAVSNAA
jgi:hypothetical protein